MQPGKYIDPTLKNPVSYKELSVILCICHLSDAGAEMTSLYLMYFLKWMISQL